jgi:seryl-tRNA synthetase
LQEELEGLKQRRDELRVQLDLGKKDVKDRLAELDDKWDSLEAKLDLLASESKDAAKDVGEAAELLLEEVKAGFKRLTGLL